MTPTISVVLPFYIKNGNENEINNLIIAIDSIVQQVYKEWELVLIDDGCNSSKIDELLKERYLQGVDKRIKLVKYTENKGIIYSLNDAISNHCNESSTYIARMDSDDISHPNRLLTQYQYLQSNQNIGIVGCPIKMFNDLKLKEIVNSSSSPPLVQVKDLINLINNEESFKFIQHPDKDIASWSMIFNCCLVHPSVMFKKSLFNIESNCYTQQFPFIEDYTFWLNSIVNQDSIISNIQSSTPLLYLRKHNNSISHKNIDQQKESTVQASCFYLQQLFKKHNINNHPTTINSNVIKFLQNPSSSSASSSSSSNSLVEIELIEQSVEYLISIESAFKLQYPNYSSNITDATNERMGEIISLCLSRFPNNKKSESLWSKWLSRNPTSQLLSLLSNLNTTKSISTKSSATSNSNSILGLLSGGSAKPTATTIESNKFKENGIRVLCFSKDRAFQLKEYLRTFFKYLVNHDQEFQIVIDVLYTYSDEKYKESYELVANEHSQVNFIKEENFTTQLIDLVQKNKTSYRFIMFAVDDILYYNQFNLKDYCMALDNENEALGFYMKMNKNITYCHTCDEQITIPANIEPTSTTNNQFKYLKWNRTNTDCLRDWNYPFDLCSTIYKCNDVNGIINSIIKYYGIRNGINHPNRFECNGNRQIVQKECNFSNKPYCLCVDSTSSPMSVVTINRVQEVYNNPIYDQTLSLDDLNQLLIEKKNLDDQKYRENSENLLFKSVHIGDLFIKQ